LNAGALAVSTAAISLVSFESAVLSTVFWLLHAAKTTSQAIDKKNFFITN
jgi:hypothetical protein